MVFKNSKFKWAFSALVVLVTATGAIAGEITLNCESGLILRGIGTSAVTLDARKSWGMIWDYPLEATTRKSDPDCLNPRKYACYSDHKAMVNVPAELNQGRVKSGIVYVTTDIGDDVPGSKELCFTAE